MSDPRLPRLDAVARGHRLAELELDQVRARMAQLEEVAAVARRIRAETTLDLPHLDDDLAEALAELDGPT